VRGTRCAGFAGWLRVVLAIVAVIAVVPAIIVRTAAPASAGTFASAINAVRISPTGSPALCWQAASAATQAAISLQNCDTASNKLQLWNIAADDRVLLNSSTSLCLDNFGNGTSIGAKLQLTDACSSGATHATWPYQLSTTNGAPVGAFFNTFVKLCANDPGAGSSPKAGDQLVRNTCGTTAADQKWSIGSADMAVTNGGNVSGKPGATVSAVLNVSNAGPQDAYLPTLAVSADPGLTIGTLSKTAAASTGLGNCTTSSATVASCAAGGTGWVSSTSGTVQVPVTIPASAKPGTTFQVCGTVSLSPTNDTVPGNNAGCVTVTVTPFESDLAMTTNKSQTSSTTVTPGSTVSVPFTLGVAGVPEASNPRRSQ